ncbi:MAG: hypothetical protein ABSD71_05380 [Bacteroidales bacterium]|jgi:hypothetical protein
MEEDDDLEVSFIPIGSSSDGMDIDSFRVMKGERFETDPHNKSWVDNDEGKYKLVIKNSHASFRLIDNSIQIDLEPGNYLFHADGVTIEQLNSDSQA